MENLTSIIRTGLLILVKLINLVNSVILFLSQMTLPRWLTLLLGSQTDCDSHSHALLDLFLSSDASICSKMAFPPLGSSDHVVISVSIDFPSNSQWDDSFHCIAYDYSFRRRISLNLVLLLLLVSFVSGFRLELMYIYLIENIRSNLTFIHVVQLIVLLP